MSKQPNRHALAPPKAKPLAIDATGQRLAPDDPLARALGSKSKRFATRMLHAILAAHWFPEGLSEDERSQRIGAAFDAVLAFKPADEIETMLAAQAIAMHAGAMECFRRAMIPDQPGEWQARFRKDGANLARGMIEMLSALDRKRGKAGNQVVRVEHVTVQPGGQAIVGAVLPRQAGGGVSNGREQEPCGSAA